MHTGDGLDRVLATAYRYLNQRERTEAEMRTRLSRVDAAPADVERAIEILREQGYLDDARFARLFAQDKRELDQWGSDRIRRTLLTRGVARELVDDALDEPPGDDSERERAVALLRRRFPTPPRDRRERERALGMLLRRGYDSELALEAIAAVAAHDGASNARN